MAFDPCREWLGIDAVDLTTPHLVLAVAPSEIDAATIRAAAEKQLATLRRIDPGPFARAHSALLRRVEEAREAMLATASNAAPPVPPSPPETGEPPLVTRSFPRPVPPPRARAFAPPIPMTAPDNEDEDEFDRDGPQAEGTDTETDDAADGGFDPAVGPDAGGPMLVARAPQRVVRPPAAKGGNAGLIVGSLALLAAGAAVLAFMVLKPGEAERKVARVTPPEVVKPSPPASRPRPEPEARPQPRPEQPPNREPEPSPSPPAMAGERPPAPPPTTGAGDEQPADENRALMEAEARARAEREAKEKAAREKARLMAEERARAEAEAKELAMREAEEARMAEERERASAGIDMALRDAYTAIRRQEFDTCDRAIASARKLAGDDPEAGARIECWALFASYAKAFPGYRDQAFKAANAGRDYDVGSKRIAMIEITDEMVVYKDAGKIERVPRERLDPEIILAIVTQWFEADGRAANHLFLGAYHLANDPPDLRRARAEWDEAGRGGETVAPLLSLLDDPVVRGAARGR